MTQPRLSQPHTPELLIASGRRTPCPCVPLGCSGPADICQHTVAEQSSSARRMEVLELPSASLESAGKS